MKRSLIWRRALQGTVSTFRGRDAEGHCSSASSSWLNKLGCSAGSVSWYGLVARDISGLLSRVFFAAANPGGFLFHMTIEDESVDRRERVKLSLRRSIREGDVGDVWFATTHHTSRNTSSARRSLRGLAPTPILLSNAMSNSE